MGEPTERFSEDALRMLRAVRFAAQLGFAIEERTEQAIRDMCGNLEKTVRSDPGGTGKTGDIGSSGGNAERL